MARKRTFTERITEQAREALAGFVFADERQRLREAVNYLLDARMYQMTDEAVARTLAETDSRLIDSILAQRGFMPITGAGIGMVGASTFTEAQRLAAVGDSRWMDHYDPLTKSARRIWTSFGFGLTIKVSPLDAVAAEVWREFVTADRNAPVLGDAKVAAHSDTLIVDGEFFFVAYISTFDGRVTLRTLTTEQVKDIVYDSDDKRVPLYYIRETADGRVAYPDWTATQPALDRVDLRALGVRDVNQIAREQGRATLVKVIHVAVNVNAGRGWPELTQALVWARAYRDFLSDRATIASSRAAYVEKVKVKGGQRAVNEVASRLTSSVNRYDSIVGDRNAPGATGSTWIENDAVTRERMDLSTGASDARIDGMTLHAQFSTGSGVPAHMLGRTDAAQNKAVAVEAAKPFSELIQAYQGLWIDAFGSILKVVCNAAEEYGSAYITTRAAKFHMDSPFEAEVSDITSALAAVGKAGTDGYIEGVTAQAVSEFLTARLVSALGARDVDAIVYPQAEVDAAAIAAELEAGRLDGMLDELAEVLSAVEARRARLLAESNSEPLAVVRPGLAITPETVAAAIAKAPKGSRRALRAKARAGGKRRAD